MDGAAHAMTWSAKGDAALKPCMECINFIARKSDIAGEDGAVMLTCSNVDEGSLRLHNDGTIAAAYERLRTAHEAYLADRIEKTDFEYVEKASGFRFEPDGLMADRDLRTIIKPISHRVEDTQHCLWVNGVFATLVYCALESIHMRIPNVYAALNLYIQSWSWPSMVKGSSANIKCMFEAKRVQGHRTAKHIKCYGARRLDRFF